MSANPPRANRPSPVAPMARAGLLVVLAAAWWGAAPALALPRLSADGPFLVPADGADLAASRAALASALPGDPVTRIESGVLERAALLAQAAAGKTRRTALDLASAYSSPGLPVDALGRMYLRIEGDDAMNHGDDFAALGIVPAADASRYGFIEAWVPYGSLATLAQAPWVRLVALPGMACFDAGAKTTEGDALLRANQARALFGIDGTGAKVGVISDGVSNLVAAQGTGDAPAVTIGNAGSGDEGTAMIEIVHDLAPGAAIAFSSGVGGSATMIASQNYLVSVAGCNVVSDDVWLPREPYFEDGPVALNASSLVTTKDVVYFTSAGNRAQRHVQQNFKDGGSRAIGTAGTFRPHDFGGGDYTLDIRLRNPSGAGVRHTIVLQWGEKFGTAGQNFDLYLLDGAKANILQASTTVQNGAGDPVELIDFNYTGPDNVPAFLVVDFNSAAAAPANMPLKILANGPTFLQSVTPAGSVNQEAGQPDVIALGAIDAADPGTDDAEAYSSRGPSSILFPAPATRNKPDAMAVDGVTVTGAGGFPTPFFGTSAASPHGAGLAALLRGAKPLLTASAVKTALLNSAVDIGAPGYDLTNGFGRLDAVRFIGPFFDRPPVADAGDDTTAECAGPAGTKVRLDGSRSSDPDNDPLVYTWLPPAGVTFDDAHAVKPVGTFPYGTWSVALRVFDGTFADTDTVVVSIVDTQPPTVAVTLDPSTLWPPNHALAAITATVTVSDVCDPNPVVTLVSVTSSEPDNGLGDGDTPNDIQGAAIGTDDREFLLRSERSGGGPGRVYTVCYEAKDEAGLVGRGCATVTVTHDQSALASFAPPLDGAGLAWDAGGWVTVAAPAGVSGAAIADAAVEFGNDAFVRPPLDAPQAGVGGPAGTVVPLGASATPSLAWYLSSGDLQALMTGAGTPILYARVTVGGQVYLAPATIPNVPPSVLNAPVPDAASLAALTGAHGAIPVATGDGNVAAAPARVTLAARTPLAPGGTLRFGLPHAARARLDLVSVAGRVVAVLADGDAPAGWQDVRVPSSIAPGVYFARLVTPLGRAITRLVLVR